jgi:nucleoside-diphosphate-sugar epimerase
MNILITGISGFVGTNLCMKLDPTFNILGVDIAKTKNYGSVNVYDWNELDKIRDIDSVIHLAGIAHDTSGRHKESRYNEINVGLTEEIYEYYLQSSAEKFIFFSSVKAVADNLNSSVLTEDYTPYPLTAYGKSKLQAEKYLLSKQTTSNKRLYILRPAMIHGPGNKGNLSLLNSFVSRGIPYPLGNYKNQRSFTSIENLTYIISRILIENIEPGIYNICDDDPLSTVEIVELMYKSLQKRNRILHVHPFVINMVAKLGDIMRLPFNSHRLKKMTENYVVSNSKIKRVLRVNKLPVSSVLGMTSTIDTLKND